ncbi:hypothetical protein Tco_1274308 [Tanacetum coccineum]
MSLIPPYLIQVIKPSLYTPPVIALVTDFSSPKPSLLVTPPPIKTEATTITTSLPEITSFISLQLRVARLEQEMSEVKKTDHSADVLASIKSQVPTVVDKYLGTKLDDALLRILEDTLQNNRKFFVLPRPRASDKVALEEFDLMSDDGMMKASDGSNQVVHEHVVMKSDYSGMRHHLSIFMYPEIKQLAIKRIQRIFFDRVFQLKALGPSKQYVFDLPILLVLITGTSQSRQHVDTSLIHIESRKSPTAVLFDDDTRRISIRHCEY